MDFVYLREIESDVAKIVRRIVEELGAPIDVVIFGDDVTRLEVDGGFVLRISLPLDLYTVMRETATALALSDPRLMEIWTPPHELKYDELAIQLSLALLKRVVDMLVAKVRLDLVLEKAQVEVVEGETVRHTLVKTLALDASVSLAVAGYLPEALRLAARLASHPIYGIYRQFWDFTIYNFQFLPIYNWLLVH